MVRYTLETRECVLEAVEGGMSVRKAAAQFGVSESFVRRLMRRKSETGSVAPLPRTNAGRKPKLTDAHLEVLRQSVTEHPSRTLREHRKAVGVDCSISVIHAAIRKLGLQDVRQAALDLGPSQAANGSSVHHGHNGDAHNGHANGVSKDANGHNGSVRVVVPLDRRLAVHVNDTASEVADDS